MGWWKAAVKAEASANPGAHMAPRGCSPHGATLPHVGAMGVTAALTLTLTWGRHVEASGRHVETVWKAPCGKQPPRGWLRPTHLPPALDQAQGGLQPRPASASLGQFGREVFWLAGRPYRPCSPHRHHACDQRARRVFPLQAGHVQAARRRRRQRLRPERLSRPRAPLTRRGHGQLWRVPARIDPPSPRRGWTGSSREGRRAHLLGDAARARV